MLLLGFCLFVVSLSQLVVGDPSVRFKFESLAIKQNKCSYFGPCTVDIRRGKDSDLIDLKFPTIEVLPPEMKMTFITNLPEPMKEKIEHTLTVCDALEDKTVGPSFTKYGAPPFPPACPMPPNGYALMGYPGPVELVPLGFPEGKVDGSVSFAMDGEPPCILMEYVAHVSRGLPIPGFGR